MYPHHQSDGVFYQMRALFSVLFFLNREKFLVSTYGRFDSRKNQMKTSGKEPIFHADNALVNVLWLKNSLYRLIRQKQQQQLIDMTNDLVPSKLVIS